MKIRIGKELHISWSILTQGENKPLEGRDLHLYLQDHNRRRRSLEFTTDANTILVVIPANTLTSIGRYALILTENEGQEGQTAVDANPAFTLVETTREEDTNTTDAPNLDVATINLATGNLTLRMVLQELFSGKEGGDMKTGDILPVLRNGELHRVSAQIGADCSAEIESLTAKVEENTANIEGAISDASEALTAAQEAQAAASTASENAAQAQELATEANGIAEQAQGTANDALSEAIKAKSNADTAFSTANSAQRTADAAQEENSSQNVRMDSIEGRVNNNQERISTVEAKNTEQDTRLHNIESRLDTDIAGATTAAQGAQAAATTASENAAQAQETAERAQETATSAQTIAQEAKETAEDAKKIKEYKLLHSHTFTEDATSSEYELLTADDGTPIHQYKDILIFAELSYVEGGSDMNIYLNAYKRPKGYIKQIVMYSYTTRYVFRLKIDGPNTTLYSECHTNSFTNVQYSDGKQGLNLIEITTNPFTYDRLTINFPFKANNKIHIYGR